MSTLLAIAGHHVGRRFTLGAMMRIGRAPDNDIVLPSNLVSRYHAQIEQTGGGYEIVDLDSKNGIFINDRKESRWRLKRADRVTLGENVLVFDAPQELKTARFTNTLIYLDPQQDATARMIERVAEPKGATREATQLLLQLAKIFETASDELPEVLETMLRHLMEIFGATAGSILLKGRDDEITPLTAVAKHNELHISRAAAREALSEGHAVLTASLFWEPPVDETHTPPPPKPRGRKAMVVPLFDPENVFGAIHLERPEGSDYSLEDVQFLQALSRLISGPIRQAMRIDQLGQMRQGSAPEILGEATATRELRSQIQRIATTDASVLITGETGTGKELIARNIHQQSPRATGPLVAINCAAIPAQLLESEFFGFERGAFTGAEAMKRGKFEMADGGTLFLDEIGELSIELQPKLLRFLEERIFYRVGGLRPIQTDVRVIAATNRNLEVATRQGAFREDLLYRLNTLTIEVPPLRERREDIHVIVSHHAPVIAARLGMPFAGVDDAAWASLEKYGWPGNVRELLQSLERALILSDDGTLRAEHFQIADDPNEQEPTGGLPTATSAQTPGLGTDGTDAPPSLADVERRAIVHALSYARGNKAQAAEVLKIHRNTLRNKMKEYGIDG